LRLLDGETISKVNNDLTNISFSVSDLNLSNSKSNTTTYIKTQELPTFKLIKCINVLYDLNLIKINKKNFKLENCTKSNSNNIVKELYKRIVIPLYIPVLILTALLLIIKSKENTNYTRLRIFVFLLGIFFIIFSETTLRFVSDEIFKNINIVIIPLVLIFILYFIFFNYLKVKTVNIKK